MHQIKKYANRKLYDTTEKRYISLAEIGELVRGGDEVCIVDNATGEDLTSVILAQLLARDRRETVEEMSPGFLAQLIRKGGGTLSGYARKSASFWHHTITMAEDEVEKLIGLLVKDREITEKEGRTLKKEILGYADTLKGWIGEKVDQRVDELLHLMKLPTREQVNRLADEVAALRRKIDQMAPPPPPAGGTTADTAAETITKKTPPSPGTAD
ncbi:MAG: polyhydroxyalkanoate synthesis regulator DNA-binding domain-containing protein [Desulfobacterales bacterium]